MNLLVIYIKDNAYVHYLVPLHVNFTKFKTIRHLFNFKTMNTVNYNQYLLNYFFVDFHKKVEGLEYLFHELLKVVAFFFKFCIANANPYEGTK